MYLLPLLIFSEFCMNSIIMTSDQQPNLESDTLHGAFEQIEAYGPACITNFTFIADMALDREVLFLKNRDFQISCSINMTVVMEKTHSVGMKMDNASITLLSRSKLIIKGLEIYFGGNASELFRLKSNMTSLHFESLKVYLNPGSSILAIVVSYSCWDINLLDTSIQHSENSNYRESILSISSCKAVFLKRVNVTNIKIEPGINRNKSSFFSFYNIGEVFFQDCIFENLTSASVVEFVDYGALVKLSTVSFLNITTSFLLLFTELTSQSKSNRTIALDALEILSVAKINSLPGQDSMAPELISFNNISNVNVYIMNTIIWENDGNVIIAIDSLREANLVMVNTTITNNKYFNFLLITKIDSVLIISLMVLNNNNNLSLSDSGPALLLINFRYLSLQKSLFKKNYATSTNPCLDVHQNEKLFLTSSSAVEILVKECEFAENTLVYMKTNSLKAKSSALSFYFNGIITITGILAKDNMIKSDIITDSGPCLYSDNDETTLTISDSHFLNNTSNMACHCIYFYGYHFTVNFSLFKGNKVADYQLRSNSFGGAIAFAADLGFLLNITFSDCVANMAGALGLFIKREFYYHLYKLSSILFENNLAYSKGGAVFLQNFDFPMWISLEVTNCDFVNNTSGKEGGVAYIHGIFVIDTQIQFKKCQFIRNRSLRGAVVYHACLNFFSMYVNCNFSQNRALSLTEGGGVFYCNDAHKIMTFFCEASQNIADDRGGFSQLLRGEYLDKGSVFINNSAARGGGTIIAHRDVKIFMTEAKVLGGSTNIQGGFIFLMQNIVCELVFLHISRVSSPKGGVITVMQESILRISHSVISEVISDFGTFLYSLNTFESIIVLNLTINYALSKKAGIFYLIYSYLEIFELKVTNCSGTLIQSIDSKIQLLSTKAIYHYCIYTEADGGCLLETELSSVELINSTFNNFNMGIKKTLLLLKMQSYLFMQGANIHSIMGKGEILILGSSKSRILIVVTDIAQIYGNLGLLIDQLSRLLLNSVSVDLRDSNLASGFLRCVLCLDTSIFFSNFVGLSTSRQPVLSFLSGYALSSFMKKDEVNKTVLISDSSFRENKAERGGSIYIYDQRIVVLNTSFNSNEAFFGGAIYINCSHDKFKFGSLCMLNVSHSLFLNNKASKSGSIIFSHRVKPNVSIQNFYLNNRDSFSNELFASTPVKIQIINIPLGPQGSGVFSPDTYSFKLIDLFENPCKYVGDEGFSILSIRPGESSSHLIGNKIVRCSNGSFLFSDLVIIGKPGSLLYFEISTNMITEFSPLIDEGYSTKDLSETLSTLDNQTHFNISGSYRFIFPRLIRFCERGEIFKKSSFICYKCPKGLFSIDPSVEQCFDCPDNFICEGGDHLLVEENFWRMSINSTFAYHCGILIKGCKGGIIDEQCSIGYTGPLCGVCLYNETHQYFKNNMEECNDCQDKDVTLPVSLLIITLTFITLQMMLSLKESVSFSSKRIKITASLLTNMLFNYIEMITPVKNIIETLPTSIQIIFSYIKMVFDLENSTGITNCFLGKISTDFGVSLFLLRQMILAFILIGIFSLPILFWIFVWICKSKSYTNKRNILILYIALFKLMIQPLIKLYTKYFDCFKVEGIYFLNLDPTIECYSKEHWSALIKIVLPGIFVLFLIPLFSMFTYIIKKRKELENAEVAAVVWIVILGYRKKYFFWEFVLIAEKIILISTPIVLSSYQGASNLVIIFFLILSIIIQTNIYPYMSLNINRLAFLQYMALLSIYSTSLLLSKTQDGVFTVTFEVLAFLINLFYLLIWTKNFVVVFRSEVKRGGWLWRIMTTLSRILNLIAGQLVRKSIKTSKRRIRPYWISPRSEE